MMIITIIIIIIIIIVITIIIIIIIPLTLTPTLAPHQVGSNRPKTCCPGMLSTQTAPTLHI